MWDVPLVVERNTRIFDSNIEICEKSPLDVEKFHLALTFTEPTRIFDKAFVHCLPHPPHPSALRGGRSMHYLSNRTNKTCGTYH